MAVSPARSPLAMTPEEREAFLAGTHVGVVVAGRGGDRPPLASPVWYSYEPRHGIVFVTARTAEKARRIAEGTLVTFLVQDEAPPQRFVAVEGPASIGLADEATRRTIARRYLPPDAVDEFLAVTPTDSLVAVRVRPRIWWSSDFGRLGPNP